MNSYTPAIARERQRQKLFVKTYLASLQLNKVDPLREAQKAVADFDAQFPLQPKPQKP